MIGLFDSGIGGLTVLKALANELPQESFIYLGDTARLPYGSKSPVTIEKYLWQNIRFLKSLNVQAVVVACNTASTVLLEPPLGGGRDVSVPLNLPIYNVIEPGSAKAVASSSTGRIGVLGTRATVAAQAYVRAIQKIQPSAEVFQQASPLLVPLVEEGWENDPLTNLIVYRYVQELLKKNIDTLILGCTHYPVLSQSIRRAVGPNVALVDSAQAIAEQLKKDLKEGKFRSSASGSPRVIRLLATDTSTNFAEVASRLLDPLDVQQLESVDI
jgi:glutamate racemase